jgi:hypothetical protein
MRRRKWIAALAGLIALALGAFLLWPWARSNRFARENYRRVENGMTRAEVEAFLGAPGDYRTWPTIDDKLARPLVLPDPARNSVWNYDDGQCVVPYDYHGRVHGAPWFLKSGVPEDTLEAYVWRMKGLWREWFP